MSVLSAHEDMTVPVTDFLREVTMYRDMARNFRIRMVEGIKEGLGVVAAGAGSSTSGADGEASTKRLKCSE